MLVCETQSPLGEVDWMELSNTGELQMQSLASWEKRKVIDLTICLKVVF